MTTVPSWQPGALEGFADGDPPAFAIDSQLRIRFWNHAAERLLGRAAEHAIDRRCFEVLRGRDVFGNRFCYENCPLHAAQRRGEAAHPFELIVPDGARGALRVGVTAIQLPAGAPQQSRLLHILRPSEQRAPARAPASAPPRAPLTAREQHVLRCIAGGLQNKEIAARLLISPATVRNHVHHVLEKLHVHSKLQAAALAHRNGWAASE